MSILIINSISLLFLIANIFMLVKNTRKFLQLKDVKQDSPILLGECAHTYFLYKELKISNKVKGIIGFTHIHKCSKCGELIERKIKIDG